MLKILPTRLTPTRVEFALAGSLSAAHIPHIASLVATARATGQDIWFDLAEVTLVERDLVEFFATGPGTRATLVHCPRYLAAWIQAERRLPIHDRHDIS
jgi:hypothetical protein